MSRPALTPEQIRQLLNDNGLTLENVFKALGTTFGDCVNHFAANSNDPAVRAARELHRDGDLEFDSLGIVISRSVDPYGDYAMAWKWVEYDKENNDADD
jgi:hypothetical protein